MNSRPCAYHAHALPTELPRLINFIWVGRDLHPRSPKASDLQSDAFVCSATYPKLNDNIIPKKSLFANGFLFFFSPFFYFFMVAGN